MKIIKTSENINSFGGLNLISKEFDKLGLAEIITESLGKRSIFCTYSYADIIKNYWMIFFAGGDCAEDIQDNLKTELSNVQGLSVPSADTLLRLQKELSTKKEYVYSKNNVENQINANDKLNILNLKLLKRLKIFETNKLYDLDFDNQFIRTEKSDSKKGYKKIRGYFPSVATIGENIVYIENRNGNCNVKFEQDQTLQKIFNMLKTNGITIGKSRMDCGSFTQKVVNVVEEHCKTFYIRAQKCLDLTQQIKRIQDWTVVQMNDKKFELCSISYAPFGGKKVYRYVVSREANTTGQIDVFQEDNFIYRAIMTNDLGMTDQEVVHFYNQRGGSEKIFDEMNNDFGWKNLPFSFLGQNTVFMILMAMCRNFYLYLINKFSEKLYFLEKTFRLKKFIFRFVVVPYKWVKRGGELVLKLYTDKPYELLV
jgi:hypothetical protein